MLSVQNLEVVYQDVILVLRGVSFEIPKGKIVSLLEVMVLAKLQLFVQSQVYLIFKTET